MSRSRFSFVEWKEEFVSQEKGSRVVHYLLKDSSGEFILAVVGTERSLRHMVYVVADEFLKVYEIENTVQAGLKWKSRREVVDWLASMLCKQQLQADLTKSDATEILRASDVPFTQLSCEQLHGEDNMGDCAKSLNQAGSDILWLGAAWACGKQLKHYPAFTRNLTTITIQSFVFVMAKEGSRYVAYLEDMYEDKKGQKKVKVRWFHHCQEVKGVINLRNAHPKEIFITPHTQVISAECVDGSAVVLNLEHFEKCMSTFQFTLPEKIHLCFRQFRNNKIKSFDLTKLRGYFDQQILSCLASDSLAYTGSMDCGITGEDVKAFGIGENVMVGTKRSRNFVEKRSSLTVYSGPLKHGSKGLCQMLYRRSKYNGPGRRLLTSKDAEWKGWYSQLFKVREKIELLCQDSGLRGCWFRCTILEVSCKQIKVRYDDVDDQDGCGNLEEWVPSFRLASPDKLGMRCPGRPTIRPCPPTVNATGISYEIGAAVDAWWSDGWWEGAVAGIKNEGADHLQVYIPGENLFLDVQRKDMRVSRDWVEGHWVDIKKKPEILSGGINTPETKMSIASTFNEDDKPADFNISNDEDSHETKADVENKEYDVIVPSDMGNALESVRPAGSENSDGENSDPVIDNGGNDRDHVDKGNNDCNDTDANFSERQLDVLDPEEEKSKYNSAFPRSLDVL